MIKSYTTKIEKKKLVITEEIKSLFTEHQYVIAEGVGCILLFTQSGWDKAVEKLEQAPNTREMAKIRRFVFAKAADVELKNSRIEMTETLLENLKEYVVIGKLEDVDDVLMLQGCENGNENEGFSDESVRFVEMMME